MTKGAPPPPHPLMTLHIMNTFEARFNMANRIALLSSARAEARGSLFVWVKLSLLLMLIGAARAFAADRPNIVFLLTDDMRWDAMACAGNTIVQTPNLDRLAAEGVRFTNMFCTTSICATSRASFLTGQYAARHGISDFNRPLTSAAFAHSILPMLREAGYYTGFVGKWGLGGELPEEGFDHWAGYSGQGRYFEKDDPTHLTDKHTAGARQFIRTRAADKPFLLCVSYKAPHAQDQAKQQFQPAHRFRELYESITIPTPATATQEAFERLPECLKPSEGRIRWQRRFATPEMFQASVKDYYRLITGVDESTGHIIDALSEAGALENTVIIFTSDNGFYLGEHGLAGKWFMHEESIRLPLIVRDPRGARQSGTTRDAIALNIDIAPTIIQLAGGTPPKGMQGRSLTPLLAGSAPQWRDDFFYEHHYGHHGRIPKTEGVRTTDWKYVRYIETDPLVEELFDLQNDPGELNNLASDEAHQSRLETMRSRWRSLAEAAG